MKNKYQVNNQSQLQKINDLPNSSLLEIIKNYKSELKFYQNALTSVDKIIAQYKHLNEQLKSQNDKLRHFCEQQQNELKDLHKAREVEKSKERKQERMMERIQDLSEKLLIYEETIGELSDKILLLNLSIGNQNSIEVMSQKQKDKNKIWKSNTKVYKQQVSLFNQSSTLASTKFQSKSKPSKNKNYSPQKSFPMFNKQISKRELKITRANTQSYDLPISSFTSPRSFHK